MTLQERFEAKYSPEPNSGCWLWTGASARDGYGVMRINNHNVVATHVSLMLDGRPRPNPRLYARHKCDNPCCVNPDHLLWGTPRENTEDKFSRTLSYLRTRKHCERGHPLEGNIYKRPDGRRECIVCKKADARRAYFRKLNSERSAQNGAPPVPSAA